MEIQYSSLSVGEVVKEGTSWYGGKLEVAIKKLDSNLVAADTPIVQRFLQKKLYEVKSLSHPNLVHVLDMVRNGDEAYLICEYVRDATPLFAVLRDEKAEFPWPLRVKVAQQVSEAVAYLHKRGVHHQNLKPSNILLVGQDFASVKVGDLVFWGSVAAQAFNSASFGKGLSRSISTAHLKVGTNYTTWVAPEPLNRKTYSDEADVYAFGLVLYSLLTSGNPPARTEQDEYQFKDLEALKSKLPADAPVELWELASKCISSNPKLRPSFERITDALKDIYAELTTEKKEEKGKGKEKEQETKEEKKEEEKAKQEDSPKAAEAEKEPKEEKKAEKKDKKADKKQKKEETIAEKAPEPKKEVKEEKKGKKAAEEPKKEESNGKSSAKEEKKGKKAAEEPKKEAKKAEKKADAPKEEAKKPTKEEAKKPTKEEAKKAQKQDDAPKEDAKKPAKEEAKKGKKGKA